MRDTWIAFDGREFHLTEEPSVLCEDRRMWPSGVPKKPDEFQKKSGETPEEFRFVKRKAMKKTRVLAIRVCFFES